MEFNYKEKKYIFKFDFSAVENICVSNGYKQISGLQKLLKKHKLDSMTDPSFAQLRFVADLVLAGVNGGKSKIGQNDILGLLMSGELSMEDLLKEINSFFGSNQKVDPAARGK